MMFSGCGVLSALVGLGGWLDGMPAALRYGLGFACFFFLIVATGAAFRSAGRRDADIRTVVTAGGDATELRQSRRLWLVLVALMGCMTALMLGAAVEIYLNVPSSFIPGASAVLGGFGLYCLTFLLAVVTGRVRRGYIRLSINGIHHRGWSFESFLPWTAVVGAIPVYYDSPTVLVVAHANTDWSRRPTARIWRIDRLPPAPMIEVDCRKFAIDAALLFHLLAYYANNPSTRTELGAEAAIERARAGDYPPPTEGIPAP
ncbi:hypothetical protein [Rhodococcus sp. PvR099]|uniref:hypothetical protein n=1 Tax=Rhodococcus sp. PvR099 TaxID=2806602 RepID=UPI001AE713EB|nr:hypothetical protein [Rhodococcus sp. PvR099]MBP1159797.1 hypothetical protein [Rhodococcus sp. PvR099]